MKNSLGEQEKKSWSFVKFMWADIEPIRGDERYAAAQEKAAVDTKITTRARAAEGVTPRMRLRHNDRVFDIDANIEWRSRGIFSEIFCKEAA